MLVCDILEKGFGIMPDGQAESQKIDFKIAGILASKNK